MKKVISDINKIWKGNPVFLIILSGWFLLIAEFVLCICMQAAATNEPQHHVLETEVYQTNLTLNIEKSYTSDDLFCMAATIYNEAGGDACSDDTRRLVGYTVLNRVNDSRYPNTIRGVLEQEGQYCRFYTEGVHFNSRCTLPQEQHAVERAYRIAQEVLECVYIPIPSSVVFQANFKQGISIYKHQDGLYFCHAEEVI